jgi:hypothetical protein
MGVGFAVWDVAMHYAVAPTPLPAGGIQMVRGAHKVNWREWAALTTCGLNSG